MPVRDIDIFVSRLERWWPDLLDGWAAPYGGHADGEEALDRLVERLADRYRERSERSSATISSGPFDRTGSPTRR